MLDKARQHLTRLPAEARQQVRLLQGAGEYAGEAVGGEQFAGVLGVRGRADTVEEVAGLPGPHGVQPERWHGTWLFVDWLEFGGTALDPDNAKEVEAIAAVEPEASRRDPYRQASRAFHLIGRKAQSETPGQRESSLGS
jgi:hypothetical protein